MITKIFFVNFIAIHDLNTTFEKILTNIVTSQANSSRIHGVECEYRSISINEKV